MTKSYHHPDFFRCVQYNKCRTTSLPPLATITVTRTIAATRIPTTICLAATYLDAKMIGCAESLEEMARMVVMDVMVVMDAMDAVDREAPRAAKVLLALLALRDRWALKDRRVLLDL